MYKNIIKIGLSLGLAASLSNAEAFKKGDTVMIYKGTMVCYANKAADAINSMASMDRQLLNRKKSLTLTKDINADYCMLWKNGQQYKYNDKVSAYNNKYSLLENDTYFIATYTNSLIKLEDTPKSPAYNFVGSDDLEAFPSDYIGKPLLLKCKRTSVKERSKGGGYNIAPVCMNTDGKYGFMGFNPFKLEVITSNKNLARKIAKSKKQEKWILGTLKKNPVKYSAEHIFEINEVQFK